MTVKFWKNFRHVIMYSSAVQWVVAILAVGITWIVYWTSRVHVRNENTFADSAKRPAIYVFWHGRTMMLPIFTRRYGVRGYAVASRHSDGRFMAKIQRLFGMGAILGTHKKGALSVLRGGVRALQEGKSIAISPDGPKGPRMRLKDGFLYFAKMTGAPIIPVCFTSTSRKTMHSLWDKYLVALPLGCVIYDVAEPVYVPRDATEKQMAAMHRKLENQMIKQMQNLDASVGMQKIEPDEKTWEEKKQQKLQRRKK
ncbi:MAG: lysophospholipid acyltransferase family protein [Rickettsiales bacterium]|jgi:lysophospholipid acyltransferase (LPLAT)-like uncharacterized protein|nr:lysophospholipid acyltransferase family protein [Rickettsiales bacterium]